MTSREQVIEAALLVLAAAIGTGCRRQAPTAAEQLRPVPAVEAIVRLFDSYRVVGLSDLHANQQLWDFIDELVQDKRFAQVVNDVTFEGGTVRYHGVLDQYINGEEVPIEQLRQVWRNNTQANTTCDAPVYLRFLTTIREVNKTLPPASRLRVLCLDPPIDWRRVNSREEWMAASDREAHMTEVIEQEGYAKNRKVLFLVGGIHLVRSPAPVVAPGPSRGDVTMKGDSADQVITRGSPPATMIMKPLPAVDVNSAAEPLLGPLAMLEQRHPRSTFVIGIYEGFGHRTNELECRMVSWPRPSLVEITGTWIGQLPPDDGPGGDIFIVPQTGERVNPLIGRTRQDVYDALLYLGPRDSLTRSDPVPVVREDTVWLDELERRHRIIGTPFDRKHACTPEPLRYFP